MVYTSASYTYQELTRDERILTYCLQENNPTSPLNMGHRLNDGLTPRLYSRHLAFASHCNLDSTLTTISFQYSNIPTSPLPFFTNNNPIPRKLHIHHQMTTSELNSVTEITGDLFALAPDNAVLVRMSASHILVSLSIP